LPWASFNAALALWACAGSAITQLIIETAQNHRAKDIVTSM
jgi:hypothetical protein